jgi:hypothetical protein
MPRAAEQDLLARRPAEEDEPQLVGGAGRPHPGEVSRQLMDPHGWMPLIPVELLQGFGEALLIGSRERGERLEEF